MAQIILTYHVLQAKSSDALAGLVQQTIRDGWQPFGSLSAVADKSGLVTYSQPIVQYLPETPQIPVAPPPAAIA